ncbi:MAG: tetratricopeptide repeat protein, partial [Candidatus Eremiobacteraeota bacterium]|nr:tetratricopeptide repeat protein [Candidatus Eremiobacteraeota bacterium]
MKRLLLFCLLTLPVWAQTDWRVLSKQVATLRQDGLYREALEVATQAVKAAEASGDIMAVGVTTNNQALLQMDLGDDFGAEQGFRKALKIYIEAPRLGPDHQYTANVRKNLALCLNHRALYPEAEQAFRKAFEVYEGLDPDHYQPETIDIMVGLANVLSRQGRHAEARPMLEEAIQKLGFGSNARVRAQQSLAQLLEAVGETDRAEELFGEAVRFYETDPEPDLRLLSRALRMQAGLYLNRMEFARAEAIYRKALDLFREAAPDHPDLANPLNDMGLLYRQIGDAEQAVTYFRQANAIHEKSLGPNHPLTCTSLTNLAQAYSSLGRHDEAEKLLREALKRTRATAGLDPVETAEALSNLSVELLENNKGQEAAALLEEALPLFVAEKARATAEGNLASAYQQIGEYDKARRHFEKALAEGDSETRSITYNNLAYLAIDQDDRESAKEYALKADRALFERLQEVFSFTSERQRLAFREKLVPYGLLASLEQPEELLQTALRFKGVVLDSIAEDYRLAQAASTPEAQALLTMLKRLKQEMLDERSDQERQQLQKQFDQAQAQLARLVGAPRSRAAFTVTPDQVRQALPSGTALVEFLYHGYYFGKNRSEKRYGALVVTREATRWVELGEAREVENVIRGYRQRMQMGGRSSRATRPSLAQAPEAGELRTAYDTVWAPVQKILPAEVKHLYISPDGEL